MQSVPITIKVVYTMNIKVQEIKYTMNIKVQEIKYTMNIKVQEKVRVMMFNAPFNNISAISWHSVLLVEETGVSGENQRSASSH
jgi:hypothetical protein